MENLSNAYVLVQTGPGVKGIARLLRGVPGVVFARDVIGPYDGLALASFVGGRGAIDGIVNAIRELPGVLRAIAAPITLSVHAVAGRDAT